jgi:hypothetical protein
MSLDRLVVSRETDSAAIRLSSFLQPESARSCRLGLFSLEKTAMKLQMLVALACNLMAVSACVLEPRGGGGRGGYNGNQSTRYRGGGHDVNERTQYHGSGYNQHDYGHCVWGG